MRRYGEQIEVQRRDDAPGWFVWRDRLYLVCEVLAHWTEAGRWWRALESGLDDREKEFWRVAAAPGRTSGAGVYDLCLDAARGGWFLDRAVD